MRCLRRRSGTSLAELLVVIGLLATLLAMALPGMRSGFDRYAVGGARETLASMVARARMAALTHGGARVAADLPRARVWIENLAGDTLVQAEDLRATYDVTMQADGAAAGRVAVEFDALGLGRLASRTFRLRRGSVEAGITISAYGRVRKW